MTARDSKPDLADVLAEVNRLRSERGLEPLNEMPTGHPSSAFDCPIARCFPPRGSFSRMSLWIGDKHDRVQPPPRVLVTFANAFDEGFYPELAA